MRQAFSVVLLIAALSANLLIAEPARSEEPLQFEVAAIKPGNQHHMGSLTSINAGIFHMVNSPLKQWVELGLSVQDYALTAPAWLDTSTFDLAARLPAGVPFNKAVLAEMMRSLLIERFGFKWHEESGIVSGYELVADKKVLAKPATILERMRGPGGSGWGPTSISGDNMSMSQFAELLGKSLGKPVVDATHLTGGFDLKLIWHSPMDTAAAERKGYGADADSLPDSVFTAIREQLGLRLKSAKVPSKVIVVDHMNRQPTEN